MAGIGVQDHRNHCSGSRNPRSRSRNRCSPWIGISVQDGPEYAAKRRFRDGEADILLCTDAAAEGLNFQCCGAVINYDMPWNPMWVEQRIGRIDRLGQRHETIRIVNLHYKDTVETDAYRALRERIGLFESVVGRLQPILAQLPRMISQTVLSGENRDARKRANVMDAIEQTAREAVVGITPSGGLDYNLPWDRIGLIGASYGFEWGGNFQTFVDWPHFQMTFGQSMEFLLGLRC